MCPGFRRVNTRLLMSKQTTIKDIAAYLGISSASVSAALAHTPSAHVRVSEETRVRVRKAAQELRYRPNQVARSLRYQKTNLIGVYSAHGYLNPYAAFTSQVIGGLHQGCGAKLLDRLHGVLVLRWNLDAPNLGPVP